MDDYETTADLMEYDYYSKLDVDLEQAQFEAEGRELSRLSARAERLLEEGRREEAVQVCPHGHVGGLTGSCSENDPRFGEKGYRCYGCGAVVTDIHGDVIHVQ